MIILNNISKVYTGKAKETIALDNISLSFPQKGFVSILGPSGCGKTTLLNLLGGLDKPTSGSFILHNKDTLKFSAKDWDLYRRRDVGFVFQSYNLIQALKNEENLSIGLFSNVNKKNKINNILAKLKLENKVNKYPHELSGGEQQRLAIARALIKKPKLILADEPTGALDSKTASEVISLLKEASKDCLVIMVTHNEKIAEEYSDRLIRLFDGKLVSDEVINEVLDETIIRDEEKKTSSFLSSLLLSSRHLLQKKIRSLLIILASSIGVIGVCLVLTISNGVQKYIIDIQKATIADSPITITSTVDNSKPLPDDDELLYHDGSKLKQYPDSEEIYIVNRYESYYNHINLFSSHFLTSLNDLDQDLYNIIDYKTTLDMKILTKSQGITKKVSTYKFMMMAEDEDYILSEYEVLEGSLPRNENEIVILVDKYNAIDVSVLNYLGIDFEGIKTYSFAEMLTKEYRVVLNDSYYYKRSDGSYSYYPSSYYDTLYDDVNNIKLKISGIVRKKENTLINIYDSGILYTKQLRDILINDAQNSQIGIEQLTNGLDKDVFTNQPFVDSVSVTATITKEYQYEGRLKDLGIIDAISSIKIYTDNFDDRIKITNFLKAYNANLVNEDKILFYDSMGDFAREFSAFVDVLTKALMIFAVISLVVSSIMIGIITYISVMERIREIGILRSLGHNKGFIRLLFNSQNALIGFASGLIGIFSASLLMKPVINVVVKIMKANEIKTFNIDALKFSSFGIMYYVVIIVVNMLLAIIAGSIPAIAASRLKPVEAINKE